MTEVTLTHSHCDLQPKTEKVRKKYYYPNQRHFGPQGSLSGADAHETAGFIFWVAKREQFEEKREVGVRGEKKAESMEEKQEYLVSGLPSINIVRAKALLKHFKSPAAVFSAPAEELQKVDGIGEKLAVGMKEALESKYKGKK